LNTLLRLSIENKILREAVASLSRPVTGDPAVAVDAALERAWASGLTVAEVKTLDPKAPEFGPHFLLALFDQASVGAIEEIEPGRFRFTAELLEGRREARERATKREELDAEDRRRRAYEQTLQNARDKERARLATFGEEIVRAAKSLGFGETSADVDRMLRLYFYQPTPSRLQCLDCGQASAIEELPRSLKHLGDRCLTATRTPAYAAAKAKA
jgi:hypothetical protein